MQDYLLFIDIEASGLPKKWEVAYAQNDNWPHAVQVAWVVYNQAGEERKREDFYIKPEGFRVTTGAIAVHGLTPEFLFEQGKTRREVLLHLQKDVELYQPMVVGHFMQFDYHVLNADFYREGLPSPFRAVPTFCTMIASAGVMRLPKPRYLHLGELYRFLFQENLEKQHNALVDATAAAACYFELRKRGFITKEEVARQYENRYQEPTGKPAQKSSGKGLIFGALLLGLLLLLYYWL